jgi:sulfite reductase alpha subunit-like flavoprotein
MIEGSGPVVSLTNGSGRPKNIWILSYGSGSATLPKAIPVLSTVDLSFCVFGLGNSVYEENFNTVAKDVDRNLHRLSANRLVSKQVLGIYSALAPTWAWIRLWICYQICRENPNKKEKKNFLAF